MTYCSLGRTCGFIKLVISSLVFCKLQRFTNVNSDGKKRTKNLVKFIFKMRYLFHDKSRLDVCYLSFSHYLGKVILFQISLSVTPINTFTCVLLSNLA